MSDAGEGLIDNDSRIQERMEELARDKRSAVRPRDSRDPEQIRALESLRLARTELQRQLEATTHDGRRAQLQQALAEIDRRMASMLEGAKL
jgi:hypothetical protein